MTQPTFYGVGVGPGDPELMTRKAERVLRGVDWIYHPAPASSGVSFVRGIVCGSICDSSAGDSLRSVHAVSWTLDYFNLASSVQRSDVFPGALCDV